MDRESLIGDREDEANDDEDEWEIESPNAVSMNGMIGSSAFLLDTYLYKLEQN